MLSHSKILTFIYCISFHTPYGPIEVDHTHKPKHLLLQGRVVSLIHPSHSLHLLPSEVGEEGEARVGWGGVVNGSLVEEVSNIECKVVGADVVIVNEVHLITVVQYVEVVEVIVAQPYPPTLLPHLQ